MEENRKFHCVGCEGTYIGTTNSNSITHMRSKDDITVGAKKNYFDRCFIIHSSV